VDRIPDDSLRECFVNDPIYCRAWTNLPENHTRPI
jgi:hypothetical protein